jgi:WD40 repeat protein
MPGVDPKGVAFDRLWQADVGDHVISLARSPDGSLLAAASVSGPITVFDAATGEVRQNLAGHGFGTAALSWGPDKLGRLASAGQDGLVKIWDVSTPEPALSLKGGAAWVERVAWSPSGGLLASAAGKKLKVWNARGELVREYPDHPSTITDIAWKPGTVELASAAYGRTAVWTPDHGEPRRAFEWKGSVLALAWSPDGKYLATGDQDSTVHFWVARSGRDLMMSGFQMKVRELSWDPTGRFLATGGGDTVCVWDCSGKGPEGREPILLEGHEAPLTAVAYQKAGTLLATASEDGTVRLWKPAKGARPQAVQEFDSGVSQILWGPDDRTLAVGTEEGIVALLAVEGVSV